MELTLEAHMFVTHHLYPGFGSELLFAAVIIILAGVIK